MKESDKYDNLDSPPKNNKLKLLVFGLAIVILSMAITMFIFSDKKVVDGLSQHLQKSDKVETLDFKDVLVNLSDKNYNRYLKSSLILEYQGKRTESELAEKSYRVKDVIITVLRKKSSEDLDTLEKINNLKKELLTKINQQLVEGKVNSVYFEDFIVQ